MFCGPGLWWIFPLIFIGFVILCMVFMGRRGRWSCCSPSDGSYHYNNRIRKLENELEKLRGDKTKN